MIELKKNKRGFSLAEALITLLIISLVALGSVPVLTKKKDPKKNESHGSWICARLYDNGGSHVSRMKVNGQVTTNYYSYSVGCTFKPPEHAKNFTVKVIGGGGGGAAGSRPRPRVFTSSQSVTVDETAEYSVTVVGAGGAGGTKICGNYAQGGGSGGWIIEDVMLEKGQYYYFGIGRPSNNIHTVGGSSYFSGGGYNFTAAGGHPGSSRVRKKFIGIKIDCKWNDETGKGGNPNGINGQKGRCGDESVAGKIYNTRVLSLTESSGRYGKGGPPCYMGISGVGSLTKIALSSGGAGRPGAVVIKSYPSLTETRAYVGLGGVGGFNNGDAGTAGGASKFLDITASGGVGGDPEYIVNRTASAPGQNASVPEFTKDSSMVKSYGGLTQYNSSVHATKAGLITSPTSSSFGNGAGSGGSGGGASVDAIGRGAKGMPGAVIIDW